VTATSVSAASVNAGSVTATSVSAASVNAGSVTANSVSATTVNAGTVTATRVNAGTVSATSVSASAVTATNVSAVNVVTQNVQATSGTINNLTTTNVTVSSTGSLTVQNGATVNMGDNVVSGVADGVNPTDAVNKRQLDATFSTIQKDIDRTGAIASAQAMAVVNPAGVGEKSFGVGLGNQGGQTAAAIGFAYKHSTTMSIRFGAGVSGSKNNVGAGMSWSFK